MLCGDPKSKESKRGFRDVAVTLGWEIGFSDWIAYAKCFIFGLGHHPNVLMLLFIIMVINKIVGIILFIRIIMAVVEAFFLGE